MSTWEWNPSAKTLSEEQKNILILFTMSVGSHKHPKVTLMLSVVCYRSCFTMLILLRRNCSPSWRLCKSTLVPVRARIIAMPSSSCRWPCIASCLQVWWALYSFTYYLFYTFLLLVYIIIIIIIYYLFYTFILLVYIIDLLLLVGVVLIQLYH